MMFDSAQIPILKFVDSPLTVMKPHLYLMHNAHFKLN